MAIVWNKVTWYSKALALIVFLVAIPVVAFYVGAVYGAAQQEEADLAKPVYTVDRLVNI
ncbi:MAG: hypothetical protein HGA67_04170 [Candidatus Yonathbacteria bacterium]|nr:hypothetical protein [Candidatus Yonathbacteria bacterium]